jgi:hypothetical protein
MLLGQPINSGWPFINRFNLIYGVTITNLEEVLATHITPESCGDLPEEIYNMRKKLTKEDYASELARAKHFMSLVPDCEVPSAPDKPLYIGCGEYYNFFLSQGTHGKICVHSPIQKATKEETEEFYRAMAEIAIR